MTAWKDVLATVGSAVGSEGGDCVLEFLKILPEEVTEGRKINLTVCAAELPSKSIQSISAFIAQQEHIQLRHLSLSAIV